MKKLTLLFLLLYVLQAQAQTINITGPAGSGQFGKNVTVLSNGNYVVTDPSYDEGGIVNVGAVYLYNGSTHDLISTLKGSQARDSVGSRGITALNNGNFVVCSQYWDNGSISNAGAATWVNGSVGISGIVTGSNSLVGSTMGGNVSSGGILALSNGNYLVISPSWGGNQSGAVTWGNGLTGVSGIASSSNSLVGSSGDRIASYPIIVLNNGNYVVVSPYWNNGAAIDAGAITWGNANTGVVGEVNSSISLVGSNPYDQIGYYWDINIQYYGVTALSNGNYVVISPLWDNGTTTDAGAATLCNGTTGTTGIISSNNSLVGNNAGDMLGHYLIPPYGVTALSNGNYVVISQYWDNGAATDAGAVTWGNGVTGVFGVVNSSNSLVGSNIGDSVGDRGVTALSNGNYVLVSPNWDNGIVSNVGAVTWGNGTTGTVGVVSSINSLVGSSSGASVGHNGVTALSNGNYVVSSAFWNNGAATLAGAVTWGNGTTGTVGVVSTSNSLVGSKSGDNVGYVPYIHSGVTALNNGNYVVASPSWDNGNIVNAGAATWCNGTTGTVGVVSTSNSIVGTNNSDRIGYNGIVALNNGNYIVITPVWNNGAATGVGAVTWGNGITGTIGNVSSSNSLVGSNSNDRIGGDSLTSINHNVVSLSNGNYVVYSPIWDNGVITNAGAVTLGNGTTGVTGVVSNINSLVGSKANDSLGKMDVVTLSNGNYVVNNPNWDNGATVNAGAVSWGNGNSGVSGIITSCNSVLGTAVSGGSSMNAAYNNTYGYLIVGRPTENKISIFIPSNMSMANTLDSISVNIYDLTPAPLIANTGCRIIATLTPGGANPVTGTVKAKVWVEGSVPVYGNDPFVARHYEITPDPYASATTGNVTLYFTQQEFNDFNAHPGSILDLPAGEADAAGIANLRIGKYPGVSSDGSGLPPTYPLLAETIDPNDTDIVWNSNLNRWEISFDVTGFSGFIVQTKLIPIPLKLLYFNATIIQNDVLVSWKTTNEINTHSFDVERSTDGRNFIKAGKVTAMNSSSEQIYNYTDAGAALLNTSKLYYRLKITDNDGRYNNSQIVLLHLSQSNSITVYPNPVSSTTTLSFSNKALLKTIVKLTDMQGKRVKQFTINSYQQQIDMSHLPNGLYILELDDGTAIKLIKN
jgi:hypothetical protein